MYDLKEPPKDLMVREQVDPSDPNRIGLKKSIATIRKVSCFALTFLQEMNGAVVFLGCTAKELVDPYNPPSGATGPYVVSGNNRCSFRFLIL